jgi:protease-4
MKKGKYILIILLIFFVLIMVTFISFIYFEFGRAPSVKSRSYLEINLSGSIQEKVVPDLMTALFMGPELSMYDIWTNIRKAKVDRRIKSIVLRLGMLKCDWAKVNEVRESILDFKKSGKKAYAYIEENLDFDKEYYLATACDEIILHPLGSLIINGIGGYVPFLKKSLEKLGVEAEIEHVEEYKTAYNMFTEEGFTPSHREMLESLYGDIFSHYLKEISAARGKSESEMKELIDYGYFQGEKAMEAGLVDRLLFEDELKDLLREGGARIFRISHETYSRIKPSSVGLNRGRKIALIYGMGPIHTGGSQPKTMGSTTIANWIKKARIDRSIAAVVFRVDSPGGSAVASDIIWREVALTKKEKPFIVSMSDVAGSGGYWVAMTAHKIVAQPQTLTGSIGVIFGKFNMMKLYEKLDVAAERITFGKRADIFSSFRRMTPEERAMIKKEILWTYDKFITKVAEGRIMEKEAVDKIGKGRVWTGAQAKELGLVDEIGGLSKAVELAKELAGIPKNEEVKFIVYPKKVSLLSTILGRRPITTKINIEPRLKEVLRTFQILKNDRMWALMPFWIAPR